MILFEVIGPDGKGRMCTNNPSCVYPVEVLQDMERTDGARYTFKVGGKIHKGSKVHAAVAELVKTLPPPEVHKSIFDEPHQHRESTVIQPPIIAVPLGPYSCMWSLCKRSKSYDDVVEKEKQFDTYELAEAFLIKKSNTAGANYWAGGEIVDSEGKSVFTT